MSRRFSFLAALWLSIGLAASVSAATVTWPGASPCNATLQSCIDGTAAGNTVEIATNALIVEAITINKSLTLRPAPGYMPVISGFMFLQSTSTAADITVTGFALTNGLRAAVGTANLTVRILKNGITVASGGYSSGIQVMSGSSPPFGNMTSEIRGNTVNVTGSGPGSQCNGIYVGGVSDSGTSTAWVTGNTVNTINCSQGEGISSNTGPGETMTIDIIGNRVHVAGTNNGIMLRNFQQTAGSVLNGRVVNNVVTGQTPYAGFPGAIVISADGHHHINAVVTNNTLVDNNAGIGVSARTDLGASINGVVANNIIANTVRWGLYIDQSVAATVPNNNNLLYNTPVEDPADPNFTPGPGTIMANPQFFAANDFHLKPTSPAVNGGANAQVPGDIVSDLDATARIKSGVVDIGAFESVSAFSDFSAEGRSDILLRNSSTGQIVQYHMNGTNITAAGIVGNPGTSYSVATIGDYNGDGKADLALQNSSTNEIAVWLMNGFSLVAGVLTGNPGAGWKAVGSGDFNGDAKADIILYNTISGDIAVWLMNGGTVASGSVLGTPGTAYRFVAAADFNADGKADVLLRNATTGDLALWLMNGTTITGGAVIPGAGPDWVPTAAADTNLDRKADIFLRNQTSGDIALWQMNGFAIAAGYLVGSPGAAYSMPGVADYNGDAKADVLLRDSSGNIVMWLLDGGTITTGALISSPGSAWTVTAN